MEFDDKVVGRKNPETDQAFDLVATSMEEISKAKQIIAEEIQERRALPEKILLFGSRSRKEFRPESDWDFYVVVDKDLPYSERREMATSIRRRLAQAGIVADIFIQARSVVRQREKNTGYLTYYALNEGVEI